MTKKPLSKDKQINKERNRLRKIYKDIPDDRKKTVEKLIENLAFLYVTLKYLQESIIENGTQMEYQNGENQYGTKQNPDITTYNSFMQRYTQALTILLQQLPRPEAVIDDPYDGLIKPGAKKQ